MFNLSPKNLPKEGNINPTTRNDIVDELEIHPKLKVKRINSSSSIPNYAHEGDSGFDLSSAIDLTLFAGETKAIPTGLAFGIPEGYEIQIRPRSGLSSTTKLRVVLGTVDQNYSGEIRVILENSDSNNVGKIKITKGMKIAQAVLAPVARASFEEVAELEESNRGTKGFGSTGV